MTSSGVIELSRTLKKDEYKDHISTKIYRGIKAINMADFRNLLTQLYEYRHYNLDNVSYNINRIFQEVKATLSSVYDSEMYNEIYDEVIKRFSSETFYYPDTIGAKLIGCYHVRNLDLNCCHIICAGNIQRPRNEAQPCTYGVFVAKWTGEHYNIEIRNSGTSNQAILYFDIFKGVSNSEIDLLKSYDILQVLPYQYGLADPNWQPTAIKPLSNDFIDVNEIPKRNVEQIVIKPVDDNRVFWIVLIVIVFILLIITILATFAIARATMK